MPYDRAILSWTGSVFRHVAANPPRTPLDFSFAARSQDNRWNAAGEPTLYAAGSVDVVIAEWARSLRHLTSAEATSVSLERTVYRLRLRLSGVVDLRDDSLVEELGFPAVRMWYANRSITRAIAGSIHNDSAALAIIVPSLAFPDDVTRWNLVVFLENVPKETSVWITRVDLVGPLRWR